MKYSIVYGDFMTAPRGTVLVHCISADCTWASKVETVIDSAYNMSEKIYDYYPDDLIEVGSALLVEDVFNIVTNETFNETPTLANLERCLHELRTMLNEFHIRKIAFPKSGSRLDELKWEDVEALFHKLFDEYDVEIAVYAA